MNIISKRPRWLTKERIQTIYCAGKNHRQWCAWLFSNPGVKRTGETEAIAIARVWWFEGLISTEEAVRMVALP